MPGQLWNTWGASVIGSLHAKIGIPNQDYWITRRYKWGNVFVVSDGLGSKVHSDRGSKAACLAVLEAAKKYQNNPEANIVDILRLIHANWLVKIAPYSPSDCSATCLFAIQIEGIITLGRLGDGMIAAFGETEASHYILCDDKHDSFLNYTHSLQQEFKPSQWEIVTIDGTECTAVVCCTDGISDDLLPELKIQFVKEIVESYADIIPAMRTRKIKKMLNEWPVPGYSDDKTIVCLFKKEGSQ